MTEPLFVPAEEHSEEMWAANSRFVATIAPAFSVSDAREFIQRLKAKYADASHNVPAFVIGHGVSTITHSSDDGEPSGTAGRPALAVLQGSGLGDAVVVVSRYFGGTKLGTGGLVRAYGDAVREVLKAVPWAEKAATHTIRLVVPYSLLDRSLLLVDQFGGQLINRDFAAEVSLTARFRQRDLPEFETAMEGASQGKTRIDILESSFNTIIPLDLDGTRNTP